jgi:omega-hydroxy-beta-dihydromenaquinone-9 sulfotransferase
VVWFTPFANKYPDRPIINRMALNCVNLSGANSLLRRRWHPVEAYAFWDRQYRGFSEPCRDLTAEDATPVFASRLRKATDPHVTPARPHLLCKITGWPRIGFIRAVYPNAKFITVIRDGRATANSLTQVHFWPGWRGPGNWPLGPLNPDQSDRWERSGRSFIALAGLYWEVLMDAYGQAKATLNDPGAVLEIRYEDLCADPARTVRAAAEFAGFEYSPTLQRRVGLRKVQDQNEKWKRDLNPVQQAVLYECIKDSLARWGYA